MHVNASHTPRVAPGNAVPATRLASLKAQPRKPGEASFFWFDPQFGCEAVKVLPGEFFVAREDIPVMTTLGSCIAACLWDGGARVGGMNHFMLPDGDGESGRFGAYAMELLINKLLEMGARRATLEAKVFGGGQVIAGLTTLNVGERNAHFALEYLRTERIPVVGKDVLDIYPRKVCFLPASGKALVKRLANTSAETALREQQLAAAPARSGSIDLF